MRESKKFSHSTDSAERFFCAPARKERKEESWQSVYSPPSPSPKGIPTRSATRSPTRCSTPFWKRTPTAESPARRPSPPALSTSWARSRRAATSIFPRSHARSSARSATTARSTASTATPAASSPTSTSRAATSPWASITPMRTRKAARATSTTARVTRA